MLWLEGFENLSSCTDDQQLFDYDSTIGTMIPESVPEGETFDMMAVELSYAGLLHHIVQLQVNVESHLQNFSASPLEIGDMLKSGQRRLDHWYNSLPSPLNQVKVHEHDAARGMVMGKSPATMRILIGTQKTKGPIHIKPRP
jgi:hypothetical protein